MQGVVKHNLHLSYLEILEQILEQILEILEQTTGYFQKILIYICVVFHVEDSKSEVKHVFNILGTGVITIAAILN